MASPTICAILAIMFIFMTGYTLIRRPLINAIAMAFRTAEICMFPYKREAGVIVIESYIAPTTGGMTGTTIRSELSIMIIF